MQEEHAVTFHQNDDARALGPFLTQLFILTKKNKNRVFKQYMML